jgi:signal transduction histidine kinase
MSYRDRNLPLDLHQIGTQSKTEPEFRDDGLSANFLDDLVLRCRQMIPVPLGIVTLATKSGCQVASISGKAQLELMCLDPAHKNSELDVKKYHQATIASDGQLIVTDCRQYSVFSESSLHQIYQIHAYAGVPIVTHGGDVLGTLSALDFNCRHFDDKQLDVLKLFAQLIATEFERQVLIRAQVSNLLGTIESPIVRGGDEPHLIPQPTSQSATIYHLQSNSISHLSEQLRSPLTSILGMARVLQQEIYGGLNPRQKTYLDIIYSSGQLLINAIDEIAQIGSIDPHETYPILAPVDLEMVCQLIIQSLQQFADRQQQQLQLSINIEHRILLLDRDKFRQIIYYPLLYLIHTTPPNHTISISIDRVDRKLQVKVESQSDRENYDPTANRPSIDNQFLRRIELGISLSQVLADIHQGRLIKHSGSYYQVLLPLSLPKTSS